MPRELAVPSRPNALGGVLVGAVQEWPDEEDKVKITLEIMAPELHESTFRILSVQHDPKVQLLDIGIDPEQPIDRRARHRQPETSVDE